MSHLRYLPLFGLLAVMLLIGCTNSQHGKKDPPVDMEKAKQLIIGKWKYQGQEEFVELEFTANTLKTRFAGGPRSGNSEGNYSFAEDLIVGFPDMGGGIGPEAKIVSITKDKMVLTAPDDPRNVNQPRLEFTRQQ